jgi:hypothetical protein
VQLRLFHAEARLAIRPQTLLDTSKATKLIKSCEILRVEHLIELARGKGKRVVLNLEVGFRAGIWLQGGVILHDAIVVERCLEFVGLMGLSI